MAKPCLKQISSQGLTKRSSRTRTTTTTPWPNVMPRPVLRPSRGARSASRNAGRRVRRVRRRERALHVHRLRLAALLRQGLPEVRLARGRAPRRMQDAPGRLARGGAAIVAQLNDASLIPPLRVRDLERLDGDDVYAPAVEFGLYAAFRAVRGRRPISRRSSSYIPRTANVRSCSILRALPSEGSGGVVPARAASARRTASGSRNLWTRPTTPGNSGSPRRRRLCASARIGACRRRGLRIRCATARVETPLWPRVHLGAARGRRSARASRDGSDADKAFIKARAQRSAKLLKKLLDHLAATSEDEDPGSILEGNINQLTAQFAYGARSIASASTLTASWVSAVRGSRWREGLAVPLARATIDKGRILNSREPWRSWRPFTCPRVSQT